MKLVPSTSWKPGHVVACVDAERSDLSSNAEYEVLDINPHLGAVKLVEYPDTWFSWHRFVCYEEAPDAPTGAAGVKFDGNKPRMELLTQGCPLALLEIGRVLTFGAQKYADHNWQKVPDGQLRYNAAGIRHDLAHALGEVNDPESGLNHLAHKACCVLFELELELRKCKE